MARDRKPLIYEASRARAREGGPPVEGAGAGRVGERYRMYGEGHRGPSGGWPAVKGRVREARGKSDPHSK